MTEIISTNFNFSRLMSASVDAITRKSADERLAEEKGKKERRKEIGISDTEMRMTNSRDRFFFFYILFIFLSFSRPQ